MKEHHHHMMAHLHFGLRLGLGRRMMMHWMAGVASGSRHDVIRVVMVAVADVVMLHRDKLAFSAKDKRNGEKVKRG